MTFAVEVELDLHEAFEDLPDFIIRDVTEQIGLFYMDQLIEEAPRDTGYLGGSFFYNQVDDLTGVIGSPVKYARYVWKGTQPHYPPFDAIEEWARRKGIPAFPVWRAIGARGTQPNDYVGRAKATTNSNADSIMKIVLQSQGML